MGMKQKVVALERQLESFGAMKLVLRDMHDYIQTLAALPEDAVLLYTLSGMSVQHEVGKSARVAMERLKAWH